MTRGMKKEVAMEEEEGEVFTISREGIGEGGHVQVLALLVPKYFLLLSTPLFGHVHCASTHMFFFSVQINFAPQLISAGHQCLPDDQHLVHVLWWQGQL